MRGLRAESVKVAVNFALSCLVLLPIEGFEQFTVSRRSQVPRRWESRIFSVQVCLRTYPKDLPNYQAAMGNTVPQQRTAIGHRG